MDGEKKKSLINTWKPKVAEIIAVDDDKIFVFDFVKKFNQPKLKNYNKFFIKKGSYEKQLDIISRYMNFFMSKYDDDDELAAAYLKIKYALDKEKKFNVENTSLYINYIYEILFTPSMCEKIVTMVEENYLDDIETDGAGNRKKYDAEDKYLESLEFTNKHIKILLRISFGMKIMAPLLFHYVSINVIKIDKNSDLIYNFYERLLTIFSEDVNIYNKLFVYVKSKVLENQRDNELIYEQRDIFGTDTFTIIHSFIKKVLISENMVKYKFNEKWDPKLKKYKENIVGFNKTIIKYQLTYFIKEQYNKNLTEVTNTKDSEGLSGIDKMELNLQKIDEGLIVFAEVNIEETSKRIKSIIDIDISPKEIAYYREHHKPNKLQIQLVNSYYTKFFGSYRDLNLLVRNDYNLLLLLVKKKLLLDSGVDITSTDVVEECKLPYILTGNISGKVNSRIIRNSKFIKKIEDNCIYKHLIEHKYKYLHQIKPDCILSLLSTFINTQFTYVTYEAPELLGVDIVYNEDKISDELLFFLDSI